MNKVHIGESVRRTEDQRFLTGSGTYIDDLNPDGVVHGLVVRAPYAHARINGFDATEARALDGVLLVLTGEDWKALGHGPIPTKSAVKENRDGTPIAVPERPCLAFDRVRYVGEGVAFIVAETLAIAREAAEILEVDYDPLDAVTHPVKTLEPGAPQLHEGIDGNLCVDWELGDREATDAAMAAADHVVTLELHNNRVTGAPIEPRGALADHDAATDSYTLHQTTQNIHAIRATYADMLGIDKDRIHHLAPDVGGGFGAKNSVYPEPALCLYATKQVGRPVKWVNDRSESFLSDTHGRSQYTTVELGLNADGKFQALRTTTVGELYQSAKTIIDGPNRVARWT